MYGFFVNVVSVWMARTRRLSNAQPGRLLKRISPEVNHLLLGPNDPKSEFHVWDAAALEGVHNRNHRVVPWYHCWWCRKLLKAEARSERLGDGGRRDLRVDYGVHHVDAVVRFTPDADGPPVVCGNIAEEG